MNPAAIAAANECSQRSDAGTITFPEVVGKLIAAGVESYHADYYRREKTYYMPGGESHVTPQELPGVAIATAFSPQGVEQAVRRIQRGEIGYMEFLRLTMLAGCVGYGVYISGRRAIYFGRTGDNYVEPFPGPK
jgi:uncharacterized protein YbcV (DUF1398 family)